MLLTEITEGVRSLPRVEKIQLIHVISNMLLEEENPSHYIDVEVKAVYPVFTPDYQEKAAAQLQKFLIQETS